MTLVTTALTGNRVLVKGTDISGTDGEMILDGSQWAEIKRQLEQDVAAAAFDADVDQFFAPLIQAADKFNATLAETFDEDTVFVFDEPRAAVPGDPGRHVHLHLHSVILRLLEQGQSNRLVWVNGNLEVVAPATPSQAGTVAPSGSDPAQGVTPAEAGNANASGQLHIGG